MKLVLRILLIGLIAVSGLWGCRTPKSGMVEASQKSASAIDDSSGVNYTLIYLIHGDANYLYHDGSGQGLQADERVVEEAISVARKAKHGEVFIFHQRPEKKILWLFPKKDRLFLHFQNGKLMHREKYSPQSATESFVAESELYNQYKSNTSTPKTLLYFGHEIPDVQGFSYHLSRKDAAFKTQTFIDGASSFLKEGELFSLTVLSTCDNGTPLMASGLQPYTHYLIASPQNLHLSHIDTDSLLMLEKNPNSPTSQLARAVVEDTFARLSSFIQTGVTLSIYDMQQLKGYADSLTKAYRDYRKKISTKKIEKDNIDCAKLPFWDDIKVTEGVTVYYQPPRFGKKANQKYFSGWGCQE